MAERKNVQDLVERARDGDRAAFDDLVEPDRSRLLARIRPQLGPRLREKVDGEDVLQEVLLRAFESIKRFDGGDDGSFGRWLDGIARNVIRNLARRSGWKRELRMTAEPLADDESPSRRRRRQERFERLSKSVESLSSDYRTVIRLARIEGLKISEIADRMNRSPSAVRNLLLRALRELKRSFGETESLSLPDRRLDDEGATEDV